LLFKKKVPRGFEVQRKPTDNQRPKCDGQISIQKVQRRSFTFSAELIKVDFYVIKILFGIFRIKVNFKKISNWSQDQVFVEKI